MVVVITMVMVACGHPTPLPRENPAGSAQSVSSGSTNDVGSVNETTAGSGAGAAPTGSGAPYGDEAHGDERHYQPLDLKVFDTRPDGPTLRVRIELPQHMTAGSVDFRWTGVFTRDGKEIAGTEFKVAGAIGHAILVNWAGTSVPSQTVRLFHPRS